MTEAFICDAVRTPIGRYAGALSSVRADDLGAGAAAGAGRAPSERSTGPRSTTSIYGCANQAGEDNRNVARMALLLAGLPQSIGAQHRQPPVRLRAWTPWASPRARSRPARRS